MEIKAARVETCMMMAMLIDLRGFVRENKIVRRKGVGCGMKRKKGRAEKENSPLFIVLIRCRRMCSSGCRVGS